MRTLDGLGLTKALVLSIGLIVPGIDVAGVSTAAAESVHPLVAAAADAVRPLPELASIAASTRRLDFVVVREGEEIGRHVIDFNRSGDVLEVIASTDIEVKAAFLTIYRFQHQSRETWRDGRLIAFDARTNDNGDTQVVSAHAVGDRIEIAGSGDRPVIADDVVPESLWNVAFLNRKTLMNPLDGSQSGLDVRAAGIDRIKCGNREVFARHYVVSGSRVEQLWFGEDDMLAKMRIRGADSSVIDLVLRPSAVTEMTSVSQPILPLPASDASRG